jgi:radical SAM protein with 4Fe4S-binding SPASM domain
LSEHFLNNKDTGLGYKTKVLAGILSKKAFAGPCFVAIGDRYQCNYRCIFCEWFSPLVKNKRAQVTGNDNVGLEDYRQLVAQLSKLGTKVIIIGNIEEPFLDKQLIEKIKYTKQHKLKCFVTTNGSLLNMENAEAIVDSGIDYLNISLNAATAETYPKIHTTETPETFDRIVKMVSLVEKIRKAKGTGSLRIRLSMVVCNRNYRDINKFVMLAQSIGVKSVLIKRFISITKEIVQELELTAEQEEETKRALIEATEFAKSQGIDFALEWSEWTNVQKTHVNENMPCYFGWLFSVIDADGNLYPCCFQNRSQVSVIGNIKQDNFQTLWQSAKYQQFRKQSKSIKDRREMGYLCNQPSCYFNNKQVNDILHRPYLYISHSKKDR